MIEELKPCPRCGYECFVRVQSRYYLGIKVWRVRCSPCHKSEKKRPFAYGLSKESAMRRWNRIRTRHDRKEWREW